MLFVSIKYNDYKLHHLNAKGEYDTLWNIIS